MCKRRERKRKCVRSETEKEKEFVRRDGERERMIECVRRQR